MRLLTNRKGVTMIEYGLLAALVAILAIPVLKGLSTNLNAKYQTVADALK